GCAAAVEGAYPTWTCVDHAVHAGPGPRPGRAVSSCPDAERYPQAPEGFGKGVGGAGGAAGLGVDATLTAMI
ncbi:MAG: hypothetical protein LBK59_12545, partial [Bifidobacteriaceae bacterium]|nr:hypothetical protein [Bifidobacteriaceae bacterium]